MTHSHPGAGDLTTVEHHRPPREKRAVGEKKEGLEGVLNLEGDQQREGHMKKKKGGDPRQERKVVISKGAQYHNPDVVTRLIGTRALMDSGSQVNMMTEKFLKRARLILRPLEDLGLKLGVEGSAGTDILYLGYTEANLRMPTANNYSSDQLFLVVEQCTSLGSRYRYR